MNIQGLQKLTLLDYPEKVACTMFTVGCNFRCPFCHNASLVSHVDMEKNIPVEKILAFLKKRLGVLDGICISGGEPLLQPDLEDFIVQVKEMGYFVKLDTNGYAPDVLKILVGDKLVDYVAMDLKNCPDKYALTVGMDKGKSGGAFEIERIRRSVSFLKKSSVMYEFRTTVVKEFHTREDLVQIADWIKGCPRYYLQQYQDNENILCRMNKGGGKSGVSSFHGYSKEEMEQMAALLRQTPGMTGEVSLRGV
jgi:pyruvate formate lyase activating enzyme